ncbi:hypothetical protein TCAL_14834 [Tigriopus californicus]|uniref:G-protein coupled receptors family 1 profile domain-containing protein n=1 Tax=Tigriopus californicus TaxID=6832 RepID=A0A553PPC5_TIGCA|nr:hypothetical protein TCAL_14834 [Tigriopus californicus]
MNNLTQWLQNTPGLTLFFVALMFTLIVVAIIGNGLILFAISSRKTLQKLPNLFIASLAFADMFVAIFVMPFALVNDFGNWPFEKTVCILWISTDVLCSTASITNLCAISLERYIHVKNPLQYFKWITKSNVLISIAGIWISSCLVSCVPLVIEIINSIDLSKSEVVWCISFLPIPKTNAVTVRMADGGWMDLDDLDVVDGRTDGRTRAKGEICPCGFIHIEYCVIQWSGSPADAC